MRNHQFLQRFQHGSISKNYGIYDNLWIFSQSLDILNYTCQSVHLLRYIVQGAGFFSLLLFKILVALPLASKGSVFKVVLQNNGLNPYQDLNKKTNK